MSRHQSYDDMLEQLARFIESLDAEATPKPSDEAADDPALEPEPFFFEEPQERKASIRWNIPV